MLKPRREGEEGGGKKRGNFSCIVFSRVKIVLGRSGYRSAPAFFTRGRAWERRRSGLGEDEKRRKSRHFSSSASPL